MKTFSINTLGCKVNQYDSQQLRQLLEQLGLTCADASQSPDLVVVNTCCVTQTASAKSRRCIRKLKKHNPDATIVAVGCLPTARPDELSTLDDSVQLISHQCDVGLVLSRLVAADGSDGNCSAEEQLHKSSTIKPKIGSKI